MKNRILVCFGMFFFLQSAVDVFAGDCETTTCPPGTTMAGQMCYTGKLMDGGKISLACQKKTPQCKSKGCYKTQTAVDSLYLE